MDKQRRKKPSHTGWLMYPTSPRSASTGAVAVGGLLPKIDSKAASAEGKNSVCRSETNCTRMGASLPFVKL